MSLVTDIPVGNRRPAARVAVVAAVGLLLGVPGVIPVWLAWFYLSNWPLAASGLTDRSPTEDDGVAVASVVVLPVVGLSVLVWVLVGRALRRRVAPTHALWFWPLCAATTLVPTLVLVLVASLTS